VCPRCSNHFSPDGRFCPFDGEPLQAAPDWDPASDPLIGSVVDGRYEVLSVLGEGGMGIVYEIRHRALGKRFALKALRKDLASDGEIAARFMQEARTAASVSHPGLVEITDFGMLPGGQPFFVMELLEGQSLSAMIRRGGPIPAERAIDIVRQIAEALGVAHEHSIIHRDLKPDNIHISSAKGGRDRVTIVDFGLAKVIGTSRLTRAGMVFGTPHYMSPEQAMGEATDHRADVYALGVVMYEMFTGRVPFEADSYMGVLTKHMYVAPTPPSQLVGTAELGALEAILLRCLEKKPGYRYATLRELIVDLDRVLLTAGDTLVVAPPRQRIASRSVIADQLELPSQDELKLVLDEARPKPKAWRLFSVAFALFLAGIGVVLALRVATSPSAQSTAPSAALASTSSLVPATPPASASPPDGALGGPSTKAAPSEISSTAAAALPVLSGALAASESPVSSTPRQGSTLAHRAPAAPLGARKKPAPLGASEIVDPWGKGKRR